MATGPGGVEEGRASIRVVPDLSGFAAELKSGLAGIAESARLEIPVVADTSGLREHVRLAADEAQALAPTITLDTNVDTDPIQRELVPALESAEGSIGRSSGLLGTWGPLIAGAAIAAGVFAPALAVIVPILAAIAPLVGAIALSFSGLKDALKPIGAAFKTLQAPITAIVTNGLAPFVDLFVSKFIPAILPALQAGARFLNVLVRGFLSLGSSTEFLAGFAALMTGAVDAISPLADLIPVIAQAFVDLGTAALPGLQALITGFSHATTQIATSLHSLAASGQLSTIITGAVAALQALGTVGAAVFGALLHIGIALAPVFVALANAIAPVIAQLGVTLAGEINALAPAFIQLINILGPALTQVLIAVTPALTALATQFSKTLIQVLPLLPPLIALAVKVLPPLATAVTTSTIVLLRLIGAVAAAITAFASFAAKLGGAVTGAIASAKTALSGLITFFSGLPNAILTAIGNVAGDFVQVGHDIIAGIVHGISDVAGSVGDAVKGAIGGALKKANVFAKINSPSLLFSKELGEPISEGIAHGVTKASGQIPDAIIKAIAPPDLSGSQDQAGAGLGGPGVHIDQIIVSDPDEAQKVWNTRWRDRASVYGLQAIGAVG